MCKKCLLNYEFENIKYQVSNGFSLVIVGRQCDELFIMIITSILQLRNQLFSLQIIMNNYQNIISTDAVNTRSHADDTLTGLFIDLIYNFNITSRI